VAGGTVESALLKKESPARRKEKFPCAGGQELDPASGCGPEEKCSPGGKLVAGYWPVIIGYE
jgi:hypothetical protein